MSKMHAFRPMLKEITDKVVNPPQDFGDNANGMFRPTPEGQVKALSENIHEGNANVGAESIDAYPDVWARVLLFEQALYNPQHGLHKKVYAEWCGFLTLFALSWQRNLLSFHAEPVNLGASAANHPFISALRLMKPIHAPLHPNNPWEEFQVFSLGGEAIGVSSPQTLVSTAVEYSLQEAAVSWYSPETRRLESPVGHLREMEYAELLCWLEKVYGHLSQLLGNKLLQPQMAHAKSLGDLLMQFAQELLDFLRLRGSQSKLVQAAEEAQNQGPDPYFRLQGFVRSAQLKVMIDAHSPVNHAKGQSVPRFNFQGLYEPLGWAVRPPAVNASESQVRVLPSAQPAPAHHLLLLDPGLPRVLNLTAHQVLVYGTHSLATLDFARLGSDHRVLNGQALEGAVWKTAADFFTEKLYILEGNPADVMPGARAIDGVHQLRRGSHAIIPILPVQEEVLTYLSIDDVQKKLSFRQDGETIQVSLRLQLTHNTEFTIHRTYSEEEIESIGFLPAVDVWPNFKHPSINLYQTYYSSLGQVDTSFYARPYISGAVQPDYVRYNANGELVSESLEGKPQNHDIADKNVTLEICRMSTYPDAMLCYTQQSGQGHMQYVGLILVQSPRQLTPQAKKTIVVGVDLGTSSTNIYMNDNGQCEPLIFEAYDDSLFLTVVDPGLITHYEDFLPKPAKGYTEKAPLLTLFKVKHEPAAGAKLESILHGHVNFIENFNAFNAREDNIQSNLKWGSGGEGSGDKKRYLSPFLEQLCLQAAMQAMHRKAEKVDFRFSYPSAFSHQDRQAFQAAIQNSIRKLQHYSQSISFQEKPMRESEASTYFFASGQAGAAPQFQRGVVILDIGGGTSDIAVIQGRDNAFRYLGSIKYAGRDLFLDTLLRNQKLLGELGLDATGLPAPRPGFGQDVPTWAYAQLDAQVKGKEQQMMEHLPHCFQAIHPLINQMAIGIAGLFYYTGTIIAYLRQAGLYEAADEMPRFYVGGNAAKIFHWFNYGHYEPGCPYDVLFEAAFKQAALTQSKYAPQTELGVYPTPPQLGSKPEVAYGLVMEKGTLNLQAPHQMHAVTIPGEKYVLQNGERQGAHAAWEPIERDEIAELDTYQFSGEHLREFLEIVNSCAPHLGYEPLKIDHLVRNVVGDLQQEFNNLQSHMRQNAAYQNTLRDEGALFIQELKFLLNYL